MKETVELMRFLRHDPVGQRFGVAILVIAWLAIAWTSLAFALAVPLLDRLRFDLNVEVALLHSALGDGERADEWRRIRVGDTSDSRPMIRTHLRVLNVPTVNGSLEASVRCALAGHRRMPLGHG